MTLVRTLSKEWGKCPGWCAQIEKLVDLPGIRELVELPLLSSVLSGILPQLVLRLFFSLMPYILGFLERLEGLAAESEVEFGVVRKYFAFQARLSKIPWQRHTVDTYEFTMAASGYCDVSKTLVSRLDGPGSTHDLSKEMCVSQVTALHRRAVGTHSSCVHGGMNTLGRVCWQ